jgi:hypothetical protein
VTTYAQDTSVSVERSRAEIEATLARYGATRFAYMVGERDAVIGFMANGKFVKFTLPLPNPNDDTFRIQKFYRMGTLLRTAPRSPELARKEWEQACRSKWRSLYLCIKAKLEAVSAGITTFEAEFLAHFVVPGGGTLGDRIIPQLAELQKSGRMPQLMLLESSEKGATDV